MQPGDLVQVAQIAAQVHPDYPEDADVFAERLSLYPDGCRVLATDDAALAGYLLSHPWLFGRPPALNSRLGRLPDLPDTFYIHDIALLPAVRGGGHANGMARSLIFEARSAGFATLSLVAVNDSAPFWSKHGFRPVEDAALAEKLASYDGQAQLMVRDL